MARVGIHPNRLLTFFLYCNLHVPVIALALISSTSIMLEVDFSLPLAVVCCAGTFVIYQLDRVWLPSPEDVINQPARVSWYQSHSQYTMWSFILSLSIGFVALFFLKPKTIWMGVLLGTIGLVYLLPHRGHLVRLKGHWFVKPFVITLCWTYGGIVLPLVEGGGAFDGLVWCFFIYRSLLIIANVLLSDLPDQRGDQSAELDTIAILLSRKALIRVVVSISALAFVLGVAQAILYSWPLILYVDLVSTLLMIILACISVRKDNSDSHLMYSYVNDLIVGWPLVSVAAYHLTTSSY